MLNEAGIGVTVNYRAVTESTFYKQRYPTAGAAVRTSSQWGEETLSLPLFPGLTRGAGLCHPHRRAADLSVAGGRTRRSRVTA